MQDLKPSYVESISAYGLGPDDPLPLLAARAERNCGVEHLPILFDSIASGKPTLALLPELDGSISESTIYLSSCAKNVFCLCSRFGWRYHCPKCYCAKIRSSLVKCAGSVRA